MQAEPRSGRFPNGVRKFLVESAREQKFCRVSSRITAPLGAIYWRLQYFARWLLPAVGELEGEAEDYIGQNGLWKLAC